MSKALDVLHKRGCAADSSFVRMRRRRGWSGSGGVHEMDRRARRTGDVPAWSADDAREASLRLGPVAKCSRHGRAGGLKLFAYVDDDLFRVHRASREEGAIQDEVRPGGHEQPVFATLWLAFSAVDDDHR